MDLQKIEMQQQLALKSLIINKKNEITTISYI